MRGRIRVAFRDYDHGRRRACIEWRCVDTRRGAENIKTRYFERRENFGQPVEPLAPLVPIDALRSADDDILDEPRRIGRRSARMSARIQRALTPRALDS